MKKNKNKNVQTFKKRNNAQISKNKITRIFRPA